MERLTKRTADGKARRAKSSTSYFVGAIYEEEKVLDQEVIDRLAEYEDKLESGQAFELPCAIHDTLYTHKKVFGKWQIEELECWGFHCDGRRILFIDCQNARTASSNSLRSFRLEDFGATVFIDKTQAERRLAELKGESK